jgi:hypothetical protein
MASPYESIICDEAPQNQLELLLTMPLSTVDKTKIVTIHVRRSIVTHCQWV